MIKIPRGTLLSLPSTENKACHNSYHPIIEASPPFSAPPRLHVHVPKNPKAVSCDSAFIENRLERPGVRRVLHPFQRQAKKGGGGRERMCRSRRKKERKKETKTKRKAPSFFLPPTSQRDCPSSVRNRIRLIIPFFLSLITTSDTVQGETRFHTGEKGKIGWRERERETHASLPLFYLRRSHTQGE